MSAQYEFRKIDNTYIVRLNKGAEIISAIKDFCTSNNIKVGQYKELELLTLRLLDFSIQKQKNITKNYLKVQEKLQVFLEIFQQKTVKPIYIYI